MSSILKILGISILGVLLLTGCGNANGDSSTETLMNEQQDLQEAEESRQRPGITGEELSDEEIIEMAEQAGIETDGKTIEEVQEELRENRPAMGKGDRINEEELIQRAEEAGIETDGKTAEEIMEELGMEVPAGDDEL
ncbi:hypothetical protein [Metabacillus bambusae]|uniref:Uncharacterized protein n=1 Tax=Metabacillus bambusae TaxID=2795218 RepID=A0ABS3MYG0_9BACI|nr:hypothetical protein [Metabacillus bambusae]MBO1510950.1 hypothetical protein [Metabacillus bambusae]